MRSSLPSSFAEFLLICCFAILAVSSAFAVNGAIQTTTSDGTVVNANIYPSKAAVYLTGGPQNEHDPGLVPADGLYYFQVTDPSGATLLSTDNISCREVQVTGGRIVAVAGPCPHAEGTFDAAN